MSIKFLCVTLPHMSIGAGVVVAITFQQVDGTPHAETGTQSDNQSLKNFDSRVKEFHSRFSFILKKFLSAAEQAAESEDLMEFFNSAVDTLQTIVVGLGGALCVWGGINLLEGYGQDNPGSNAHVR